MLGTDLTSVLRVGTFVKNKSVGGTENRPTKVVM